jgi:hypothetical protein
MSNTRFEWEPDEKFELSGEELAALLNLGELHQIRNGELTDEIRWKVYGRYAETKSALIEKFLSDGKMFPVGEKPAEKPTKKKAKAKA